MSKLVAILLATFNGSRYLREQLDSIEAQDYCSWVVIASDDGSSDDTIEILKEYQKIWGAERLIIREGPKRGFCQNFLSMACDKEIKYDWYAFCDQDDVWMPKKLTTALYYLERNKDNVEYLYCGRTIYVEQNLRKKSFSPLFVFPRSFKNALVQSIAGGNTMVFNNKAKALLEKVGVVDHPSHDWWLYQLVTGVGGIVFYDPEPQILYRQHSNNIVGDNISIYARLIRLRFLINGKFRMWSEVNISLLLKNQQLLNHDSKETLKIFKNLRTARLRDRLRLIKVAGLYRQSWAGTLSLYIAVFFNKI
jgi:glycosyltransferase involved in cell wall biosynthesis